MGKFKVGDWVIFRDEDCVSIDVAAAEWPTAYKVLGYKRGQVHLQTTWDDDSWTWGDSDFTLAPRYQQPTTVCDEQYHLKVDDSLYVGSTEVYKAKRKSNGKTGYVIKQAGANQNNTVVFKEDLLKLAALLADIDAGVIQL